MDKFNQGVHAVLPHITHKAGTCRSACQYHLHCRNYAVAKCTEHQTCCSGAALTAPTAMDSPPCLAWPPWRFKGAHACDEVQPARGHLCAVIANWFCARAYTMIIHMHEAPGGGGLLQCWKVEVGHGPTAVASAPCSGGGQAARACAYTRRGRFWLFSMPNPGAYSPTR